MLVGRICKDLELKYTQNNIANLRFTLAVNRQFANQQGERQADFINCVSWRTQAENMARFLKKGSLIGVTGRIETGSYQNQQSQTVYTTDVIADSVQFLEPRGMQGNGGQQQNFDGNNNFGGQQQNFAGNNNFAGYQQNNAPQPQQSNPFPTNNPEVDVNPFPSNVGNSTPEPTFNSTIDFSDDDLPFL